MHPTAQETLSQGASDISHQLRNTLTSAKIGMEHIKSNLSPLIETYKIAKKNELATDNLSDKMLAMFEDLIATNCTEMEYAALILKLFSANLKVEYEDKPFEKLSVKQCLEEALSEYPYRSELQKNITKTELAFDDFEINGHPPDIKLLFMSIIHNILSRTTREKNGVAQIKLIRDNDSCKLIIKDAAKPLSLSDPNEVFERLHWLENKETQTGLFACKQILNHIGGDIHCSIENDRAVFTLSFPCTQ